MVEPRTSELIGQHLRQARETRRITVEQAATALHIRLRYVEAMDKGNFDIFPSPVQARGFLRSYVQYLDLEVEPFLAALDGDPSLLEEKDLNRQERGEAASVELRSRGEPETRPVSGGTEHHSVGVRPYGPEGEVSPERSSTYPLDAHCRGRVTLPLLTYRRTKFDEIGQKLRLQRENLGLSLDDVERHTRLRAFYLKALEAGELDGLPSPVQGRGMLKNYARFLGLDAEVLLLLFAEGLQASLADRQGPRLLRRSGRTSSASPMGSPQLRLITTDLLLAGVLVVFLIAFIAWGVIRISSMRSGQAPTATAPAIVDVLAQVGTPTNAYQSTPTPVPSPTNAGLQATPQVTATPRPDFGSASVQVILLVRLRAWMRVTVDGKVEFEGRVLPGSAFPFAGDERVEILTGNGAGLEVNFNQTDMGTLGTFGEAVLRVFTVQGMQTPTATITRTPARATITPTLTPTP